MSIQNKIISSRKSKINDPYLNELGFFEKIAYLKKRKHYDRGYYVEEISQDYEIVKPVFSEINGNKKVEMKFDESLRFDPNTDVLLHGTLHVIGKDGQERTEDIYLFQSMIRAKGNIQIKPTCKNGLLNCKTPYMVKTADGTVLGGYVPKRELVSEMRFDFDKKSPIFFPTRCKELFSDPRSAKGQASEIQNFINIEFDRDGYYYKAVDMNDKYELEKFKNYCLKHKDKITAKKHFKGIIDEVYDIVMERYPVVHYSEHKRKKKNVEEKANKVVSAKEPKQGDNYMENVNRMLRFQNVARYNAYHPENLVPPIPGPPPPHHHHL